MLAASRSRLLDGLLQDGLVIVEQRATIGARRIVGYAINSDSLAETLLSCIAGNPERRQARSH